MDVRHFVMVVLYPHERTHIWTFCVPIYKSTEMDLSHVKPMQNVVHVVCVHQRKNGVSLSLSQVNPRAVSPAVQMRIVVQVSVSVLIRVFVVFSLVHRIVAVQRVRPVGLFKVCKVPKQFVCLHRPNVRTLLARQTKSAVSVRYVQTIHVH